MTLIGPVARAPTGVVPASGKRAPTGVPESAVQRDVSRSSTAYWVPALNASFGSSRLNVDALTGSLDGPLTSMVCQK